MCYHQTNQLDQSALIDRLGKSLCALMYIPYPPKIEDLDLFKKGLHDAVIMGVDREVAQASLEAVEALRDLANHMQANTAPQ